MSTNPPPTWLASDAATLSETEYRAAPSVNFSTLKLMAQSPAHYKHAIDNPSDGNTYSRDRLRAAHCAVLEPEHFDRDFAVWTGEGTRASKAYKAWAAENEGRTLLKSDEYDQINAVAEAVRAHPVAGPVLASPGWAELSVKWTDARTGLACKGRLDWLAPFSPLDPSRPAIYDLKQIDSTDPRRVAYHVSRMGWHVQAAHYSAAVETLSGTAPDYFVVVVESKAPHDVAVYHLHREGALYLGQRTRDRWLDQVVECRKTDRWPGRLPELTELVLPEWMAADGDDDNDTTITTGD